MFPHRLKVLILVACLTAVSGAGAVEFSGLYIFGDSLSDSGQFASPGLFPGTFTNPNVAADGTQTAGTIYAQRLAALFGLGLAPSTPLFGDPRSPANNFAVGGNRTDAILASIISQSVVDASAVTNLPPGVLRKTRPGYLVGRSLVDPNALHVLWGGGNDIRDGDDPVQAATNMVTGANVLSGAGAGYILVNNTADIGAVPESFAKGLEASRHADSITFNSQLNSGLNGVFGNVIQTDVYSLFNEVLANPTLYGFADIDHSKVCYDSNAITGVECIEDPTYGISGTSPDAWQLVFWDGIHPTQHTHAALTGYFSSIIEAPGMISTLSQVPISAGRDHQRSIEQQIGSLQKTLAVSEWAPFASGSLGRLDADDTDEVVGFDDDSYAVTLGVARRFSENVMAGLAFGYNHSDVDFDANRGGFKLDGYYFTGFTGYERGRWFADAALSYGALRYDDIERVIPICLGCRKESGDTSGDQWIVAGRAGVDLLADEFTGLGPVVGLRYQNVDVDSYVEDGLPRSSTMRFASQDRDSVIASLGLFVSRIFTTQAGEVELSGLLARDFELQSRDQDRVEAGLVTLPGSRFRMPAIPLQDDAWKASVGVTAKLSDRLGVNANYTWRRDDDYATEQYFGIGVNLKL